MPKKILIVDDEPDLVSMVQKRLEANGFAVVTAADGDEGLEKAKSENPDLIILDVQMPKVDGYTFILEFKKFASLEKTPIIILTAKDQLQDIFKMEGVKEYCVKPFEAERLLEKIRGLLNV